MATKLKSASSSIAASVATNTPSVGNLNLYTLPLEILVVNYANSVKGDKPKVILQLAVPIKGIGTVQIFAPSYLSFDEQRAYLSEYFEHGDTLVGADNQPEPNAEGVIEGIFFKRYEMDGPNFEVVTTKSALGMMKTTGLNSSVMQFGVANAKLSREQINTGKNIQRGNVGTVAVTTEGGVMSWLSSAAKNLLG